ncbi:putative aminophospholipid-translocase [Porites harrisoni]
MLLPGCRACFIVIVQLAAFSGSLGIKVPYFIEEPSDIYARRGRPTLLKCQVGGDPKPSIRWRRNGVPLSLDSRRTINPDGSLYFSEIIHNKTQKPDEGTYQCEGVLSYNSEDYRIISRTARLIIAGISSKVSVTPSVLNAIQGDTSRLFCSVKHSTPKALIAWKKQGSTNVTITTGNHFTLTPDGALQIRNIRFEDQGKYECIAVNNKTMRQHTSTNAATVQVLPDEGFPRRPYFEASPKDTVAVVGSKVVLECLANGSPKPRVTWLRDGVQVGSQGYSIFGESNLMILSVSVENAGTYTCRASALNREEETTAKLEVHYGPVFTKKPNAVNAYENTNARFECRADGIPKPNITWTKNGEELVNKAFISITDGYLTVNDLVPSDKGVYQCFAKNNLGKIQASAQLSVYREGERIPVTTPTPTTTQEPTTTVITTPQSTKPAPRVPEKPENVKAVAVSHTEINVSWSPPSITNGEILKYRIFCFEEVQKGSSGSGVKQKNMPGDSRSVLITDLKPDTKYRCTVFAHNEYGAGRISDEVIARTYPSSDVPGRPLNLVAEAVSESTVRVTWAAPTTGASPSMYVIIYKDVSGDSGEMRDVTKQQTRLLRDLKTYTKYTITVFGVDKRGIHGPTAETEVTTRSGVPSVTPTDFVLKRDSSGTRLISTWKAPDSTKVNGRITYYVIKYRKFGSTEENTTQRIAADKLAYVIKGLMPSTRYEAKIAAGTESGLGLYTQDWVEASTNFTDCNEETVPGKPRFDSIKRFPRAILVKWLPPDNSGLICVTGYSLGWGKNTPYQASSKPLSGDKTQYLINDLEPEQKYVIKLYATNSNGNGLDIQMQVGTLAGSGQQEPVKNLKAIPLSSNVMYVSWKDTKVSTSVPIVYHVYHSVHGQLKYCGNTTAKHIKCNRLKPFKKYMFYVRRNEEGFNATVSNFTMEDKPGPPMHLTGNPNETNFTRLTLNWQPPRALNGPVLEYRIFYSKNSSAPDEKWKSVKADGSSLTKEISGLKPGTAYFFKMQARTKKGWGPMSSPKKFSTLSSSPGSIVTISTGLSSPAPTETNAAAAQAGAGGLKNKTLWIVIAAVAGITLIAIIIISVILCKKRSGDDIHRKPPTYKQVIQANGSAKKKHKEEKPPDLWINHTENLEMKPVDSVNPAPDVCTNTTALIPRRSEEMKPVEDSPLDHLHVDNERSSFLNGSDGEPEDFDDLPPPPVFDSKSDPYLDYPDDNRTPTPPPSPGVSPFNPPRSVTPENVKRPMYPMTSTPRYQLSLPRTGSFENNTLDVTDPRPPKRSRSYDPDFGPLTSKVPVYPVPYQSPVPPSTSPKPKSPVAPADDIQLPPIGFNRKTQPNGYWTPPPKYDDIFARRSRPPSSPQKDAVVADLDKEIAGLEGLMRDLNEITAGDYII